jgi:hypothetical protein
MLREKIERKNKLRNDKKKKAITKMRTKSRKKKEKK